MNPLKPTPVLKGKIRQRFRHECAACTTVDELAIDVAHLFEDATRRQPRADRLILLCSSCNQAEDRSGNPSKPPLSERFDEYSVGTLARSRYRAGNYQGAYGSNRLAAYFFEKYGSPSKAVAHLTDAISALRPIRWGDFLKATLLDIERLCVSNDIGLIQRWLALDRFALVLFDYRRWKDSAEVAYAATLIRDRVTSDDRYPEELRFDRLSSFRRSAMIRALTQSLGKRETLGKLLGELHEHAQEFARRQQYDAFATNLDVAGKLAFEVGGDHDAAHRFSLLALEREAKITHKWVLQEHHWREAAYYHMKRDRVRVVESVANALRMFRDHPVVLEPTLGAAGPVAHKPRVELLRFGITEDELRERGVAPSQTPPPELPLRLRRAGIHRICNGLLL